LDESIKYILYIFYKNYFFRYFKIFKICLLLSWNKRDYLLLSWSKRDYLLLSWNKRDYLLLSWNKRDYLLLSWNKRDHPYQTWHGERCSLQRRLYRLQLMGYQLLQVERYQFWRNCKYQKVDVLRVWERRSRH